ATVRQSQGLFGVTLHVQVVLPYLLYANKGSLDDVYDNYWHYRASPEVPGGWIRDDDRPEFTLNPFEDNGFIRKFGTDLRDKVTVVSEGESTVNGAECELFRLTSDTSKETELYCITRAHELLSYETNDAAAGGAL